MRKKHVKLMERMIRVLSPDYLKAECDMYSLVNQMLGGASLARLHASPSSKAGHDSNGCNTPLLVP